MTDIATDPLVRRHFPALAEAALVVGAVQIRNRATLAGNLCNASPAADTAPSLLVYGASVVVAGPAGERRIPVAELWVRSGVTTLAPGELVTAIELPIPGVLQGSAHLRRTRRRGHDLAAVTLACAVDEHGTTRLAYGSVGPAAGAGRRRRRRARGPVGPAGGPARGARSPAHRRQPVADVDARQPRLPARDAPRARPARSRPGGGAARRGPAVVTAGVVEVGLTVNGRARRLAVEPRHTLLDALRDDLGLTGTKECCLVGECGACTVIVDGRSVDSCLVLAAEAEGWSVTTVEGLAVDGRLDAVQEAFLDTSAAQCGFCIPGQVMSAEALLAIVPRPDPRGGGGGPRRQPVPVRGVRADHRGRAARRAPPRDGRGASMTTAR